MSVSNAQRRLIVFPTELSRRRFQQTQALEHGWVDASTHLTFARLRKLCIPYARLKGGQLKGAKGLLKRRQVVEVAHGHFVEGGPLGELSLSALGDVLEKLLAELALLPVESDTILNWLLDHHHKHKLYQLGILYSVWRATIKQEGFVDQLDVNLAILKLLKRRKHDWPPLLRNAEEISFRSVRWFNPFEESCVLALNQKLEVRVESALPPAHAEEAADRLGQQVRSEIMAQPWAVWAEDLGDALAVDSSDLLQLSDSSRINFSRSAGAYGEIEDLARRICWNLQYLDIPANRIALVVPSIGAVQDIIPHVFSRFQIPYFFRRGRPVLSSPCVKAFLAWLSFPIRPERDTLIDLVRNPAIHFKDREETIEKILKQKLPPRLNVGQASLPALRHFQELDNCSGNKAAEILKEQIIEPEDHFNAESLKIVQRALEGFGEQKLPLHELIDLLEELLENETIRPRDSHEQGVWILNPHDAVGLDFDLVLFPASTRASFPEFRSRTRCSAIRSAFGSVSIWKNRVGIYPRWPCLKRRCCSSSSPSCFSRRLEWRGSSWCFPINHPIRRGTRRAKANIAANFGILSDGAPTIKLRLAPTTNGALNSLGRIAFFPAIGWRSRAPIPKIGCPCPANHSSRSFHCRCAVQGMKHCKRPCTGAGQDCFPYTQSPAIQRTYRRPLACFRLST